MFYRENRSHYTDLLKLGLPIMVGQLGMIILSFADTIMVGRYGTTDLAAASMVNNLFNLIIIFATGFSYGLTPMVGNLYGQQKKKEIGGCLKNGLYANFSMAVLLTFVMTLLYQNLECLGQPEELLPLVKPYYLVLLCSLVFVLIFSGFKQFADGITDTSISMWILLSGNILNIIGNYFLIYGKCGFPEWGLFGAGVATLCSRIYMVVIFCIIFLIKRSYAEYRIGFKMSSFSREIFIKLNKMGWSVAMQMGIETASFSVCAIMVGWLGAKALAAHQIMLTIGQLGFMMYFGMAAAVAVRISFYHGRKDYKNIQQVSAVGMHIIFVLSIIATISIYFCYDIICTWFTVDLKVQELVKQLVLPFVLYQFGDGLQCNYSNSLRGISDVKPMMYIALVSYVIVAIPLGYLFAFVMKGNLPGIWFSFPFGLTIAGILYYLRFKSKLRKYLK